MNQKRKGSTIVLFELNIQQNITNTTNKTENIEVWEDEK